MSDIKSQVEECLKQAEEIERAGVIKDKLNTTFRENLRYEFLKFLVYLSDGDGYVDEKEIAFINSTLGYRMTEGQIKSIMFYDKLHDDSYTRKVPFALKGFVLCDAGRKLNDDKKRANNLVNTFRALGQEFVACNDVTSEREVNMLTDYLAVMEKFLKEYGLYDSKLSVKARKAEKRSVDEVLEELNQLVGLDGVKQEVNSLVNLLRIQKLREEKGMKQPNVSKHLVFSGNPGTGKTHIATALGIKACMEGYTVFFTSVPHLLTQIRECRSQKSLRQLELRFEKYDMVICDEFGYVSCDKEGGELLFNHLSLRAGKKATIITTNLSFDRWGEIVKDKVLVAAMVDRLTHKAHLVNMSGQSYRVKETQNMRRYVSQK